MTDTLWVRIKTWLAIKLDIRNPKDLERCISLSLDKGIAEAKVRAQAFLLEQAPMIDLQKDHFGRSVTPFAYVNPQTWGKFRGPHDPQFQWYQVDKSPTTWIVTDLMPEGRVIYSSSNPMLGVKP